MREHEVFRVGMRIVGLGLLAWLLVDGAHVVVVIWNLGKLIYAGIVYGSTPGELLAVLGTRAAGFFLRGALAWYLLFRGSGLLRRVYPGAITASATA